VQAAPHTRGSGLYPIRVQLGDRIDIQLQFGGREVLWRLSATEAVPG
jgi:hypothetical protein